MPELTNAKMIWNRACGEEPLRTLPGDRALADLLRTHNLAMNGGVLQAVECLTASELSDAESGYRFYGFDEAATLLTHAGTILASDIEMEFHERQLDQRYANIIPEDSLLVERFEKRLELNPFEYAPLRDRDNK